MPDWGRLITPLHQSARGMFESSGGKAEQALARSRPRLQACPVRMSVDIQLRLRIELQSQPRRLASPCGAATTRSATTPSPLFRRTFGWTRAGASTSGFDATDPAGLRYKIRSRRVGDGAGDRQLSDLRNLAGDRFDQLAAVLFAPDLSVHRPALVPINIVKARVRRSSHTNSGVLHLRDDVWSIPGVVDVTQTVRAAAAAL